MSSLREAAQRLLVALDQWREKGGPIWQCDPAIDGLRAALAQQAEPAQEPITRLFGTLPVYACPDCRGLGYDASGQTCACQGNPSFG